MAVNYLSLANYTSPTFTVSTLTGSTITAKALSLQSTTINIGQSTNQSYVNFTNGSFFPSLMTSTLTSYNSLSTVTKVSMSQDGRLQYALQSVPSTLSYYQLARSVDTGVTWNTLNTSTMGLPQGSLAYQSTVSGTPTYSNFSQSATGQYALAATSGGQLYVSNNASSATPVYTPANVGGAPYAYLPMDSLPITDMMGNTTITVTGSAPLVTGKIGTSAINLVNTAGGTATNYVTGTWTGATNFTVSFWFNARSVGANQLIFGSYNTQCDIFINSSNALRLYIPTGISSNTLAVTGPTISQNTWYNVVVVFQTGGACSLYVNGTFYGSATNSGALPPCTEFCLGTYGNGALTFAFNGYIDDFRIYNFAAPNVVDPYIYLPLDGNVVDAMGNVSAANLTATGGPAYIPGIVGTQAIYLANTIKDTPVHYITSTWTYVSTFSVSFWFNMQTVPSGQVCLFGMSNASSFSFQIAVDTGAIYINTLASDSTYQTTAAAPISANTWYYVTAIYQQTGSIILYLNNVLISSITAKAMLNTPNRLRIGAYPHTTGAGLNGYIDDFRFYNYTVSVSPIAPMNWSHTAVSGTGQYMMAAAANGGVFCSTNYGATWSQLTASQIPSLVGTGNAAKTLMGPIIQPNSTVATAATWSFNGVTWTASSSTNNNSASFAAWVAFNGTAPTSGISPYSWASNAVYSGSGSYTGSVSTSITGQTAQLGEWIQIQSSVPLVMYSYSYGCGARLGIAKTHFIVGSNDGSTWYPIQSAVMSTNPLATDFTVCTSYLIVNQSGSQTINGVSPNTGTGTFTTYPPYTTTAYTYFRLIVTSTFNAGNAEYTELYINFATPMPLLTAPATAPNTSAVTVTPQMTNLASNTWTTPNGVTWTILGSSTYSTLYAYNVFNNSASGSWGSAAGTYSTVNGSYAAGTVSTSVQGVGLIPGEYLQVQTSAPLVMTSYTFASGTTVVQIPKTYYIVGSNDLSTWYPIHYMQMTGSNAFTTTSKLATNYLVVNQSGSQTLQGDQAGVGTVTTYSTTTNAYTYFRLITTYTWTTGTFSSVEIGEWFINFTAYTPNPVNALAITNGGQTQLVAATGTTMPNLLGLAANTWTANGVTWTASASTTYGGYSPYGAFNIIGTFPTWNSGTFYNGATGAYTASTPVSTAITGQSAQTGEYLQLQSSVPLVLYSYSIATGGWWQMPKTYWIVGSNDGSTWFPIQSGTFAANPYNTNFGSSSNYIYANNASAQTFVGNVSTTVTTVTYAPYTTQAYIYFRMIYPSMCGNPGGTNAPNNDSISIGELLLNFQSGSTYLSTNYGASWSTAVTAPTNAPFLATSGNGLYTITGSGQIATLYNNGSVLGGSALQAFSYTTPTLTGINANINCASISSTGQNMVILTQGTTNNVFYSTNFGVTFTGMTVGTAPMTSCAMSADGNEIMVSNAANVWTLNRNTQGFSITMGNQSGLTNQGQNSIAIGNLAGVTNQSANSIILNASGAVQDAYNPGFFVSPVLPQATSTQTSVNLLGYGADNQVVQTPSVRVASNGATTLGAGVMPSATTGTVYGATAMVGQFGDGTSTNWGSLACNVIYGYNGGGWTNYTVRLQRIVDVTPFSYIDFQPYVGNGFDPNGIAFGTGSAASGTEFMRIRGNGNVGIGTTNPNFPFTCMGMAACFGWNNSGTTYYDPQYVGVEGIALRTYSGGYGIIATSANTTLALGRFGAGAIAGFSYSPAIGTACSGVGSISVTSSATAYNTGSDSRLKENIQDVADIRGMLNKLRPRTYHFIKDENKENQIGFIAQEVRENFPQYVSGQESETEYLALDYGKFSPFAISACKDLYLENDALKIRVAELESQVSSQSEQLTTQSEQLTTQSEQLAAQSEKLTTQSEQLTEVLSRLAALESK